MARYSAEFKKNAVSLFRQEGISKTCRQLHVTRATIYRWVKQDNGNADHSKCGNGMDTASRKGKTHQTTEKIG